MQDKIIPVSYTHLDVYKRQVTELRKMQAWLSANPKRRKTKKGILRFIVNWLMKEQDKPHREVTSKNAYPNL